MIALVNFNSYLGGGETLFVRWGEWLQKRGEDFLLYYSANSYIEKDLARIGISAKHLRPIKSDVNYYYLGKDGRTLLIEEMLARLENCNEITFVSFCARDLYTLVDLTRNNKNYKIAHLVLHNQDNLYICQSLWDKLLMKFNKKRRFSRSKALQFNITLFDKMCRQSVVIPQSELQARLWNEEYHIHLNEKLTVPLPVCNFSQTFHETPIHNNKIVWVGRIVDFKIPALCAMIDYIGTNCDYTFSIVGDGEDNFLREYIKMKGYNTEQFKLIGKVNYSDLPEIIKGHSIGYAMGTSIVEIGKHGIPVIMALASPDLQLYESPICGGVYVGISKGNVGDTLYYKGSIDNIVPIEDAISMLEADYTGMSGKCYKCIKDNFDSNNNFELYMNYLSGANHFELNLEIPHAPFLRKVAYRIFEQ